MDKPVMRFREPSLIVVSSFDRSVLGAGAGSVLTTFEAQQGEHQREWQNSDNWKRKPTMTDR